MRGENDGNVELDELRGKMMCTSNILLLTRATLKCTSNGRPVSRGGI